MNYVDALAYGFPAVLFQCTGDMTVYENITHLGGADMPSKEALDSWLAANPVAPNPDGIVLTKYEFRKLFTFSERVAIDNVAENTNLTPTQRGMVATLLKDLETSGAVFLTTNPDVAAGLGMMESFGLIGSGRAAQILANQPPQ